MPRSLPLLCPPLAATLALFVTLAPGQVRAEDAAPLKTAELSARLYQIGQATEDPVLIIAAAKLRKSLALEPVARAPAEPGAAATATAPLAWEAMLDSAAALATDDPGLTRLIEDIRAESDKGMLTGPVYSISGIRAGGNDTYPGLAFQGGAYAEIYVEGEGVSDLNLYVFDEKDRLVCSDTDISDIAYCGWRPASSASFTVSVENTGSAANSYSLMTN